MTKRKKEGQSGFRKGRRPHNASKGEDHGTVAELVCRLAAETKRVSINGKEVEMSWAERSFRLMLDRALTGNRRDLAQVLRLMIDHPSVGGSYRERTVIFMNETLAKS